MRAAFVIIYIAGFIFQGHPTPGKEKPLPPVALPNIAINLGASVEKVQGFAWEKEGDDWDAFALFDKPCIINVRLPTGKTFSTRSDRVSFHQRDTIVFSAKCVLPGEYKELAEALKHVRNICKAHGIEKQQAVNDRLDSWEKSKLTNSVSVRGLLGYKTGLYVELIPILDITFLPRAWWIAISFEHYRDWDGLQEIDPAVWKALTPGKR